MSISILNATLLKSRNSSRDTGWGKGMFTVMSAQITEFILALLFISYFHTNSCKPTFAPPRMLFNDMPLSYITTKVFHSELVHVNLYLGLMEI